MATSFPTTTIPITAEDVNRLCNCIGVERERLRSALDAAASEPGFYDRTIATRANLFSAVAVFLSQTQAAAMQATIAAAEHVIALPAYREAIQAWAPQIAGQYFGPRGAFVGYDFHLSPNGPQLIEINTNAGGGMLNAILSGTHRACCEPLEPYVTTSDAPEQAFLRMFEEEWRRQRGDHAMHTIAIVDDTPADQYLAPEFTLFLRLFESAGWKTVIADPAELRHDNGRLWFGNEPIDLVYNRLTDFALDEPAHTALRSAYLADAVVVTPHPQAHAMYADKRNLTLLTNASLLRAWGVAPDILNTLIAGIPQTIRVNASARESLWSDRRTMFFKPATGFGGRAAYRGEKLTRGTFEQILQGEYVAQREVAPSERRAPSETGSLKLDIRCYTYEGQTQLLAARLYRGQTTNFRTPGGGFAPVYVLPDNLQARTADVLSCLT